MRNARFAALRSSRSLAVFSSAASTGLRVYNRLLQPSKEAAMKQVVFVLALTFGLTLSAFAQSADETALRDIEQRMHDAKLANDVATLDRYLHADFFSTNQTGNQRDK